MTKGRIVNEKDLINSQSFTDEKKINPDRNSEENERGCRLNSSFTASLVLLYRVYTVKGW